MSHTTSDARKRAADGHQCCVHVPGLVEYADRLERQIIDTVPRVARSVDDLRVGMVVAWYLPIGMPLVDGGYVEDVLAGSANIRTRADASKVLYASDFDYGQVVVILADAPDPPARDWLVPATQMEALREALIPGRWPAWDWDRKMRDAARAVLDAAREVEHE